jgi:hypothetical protein
MGGINITPGSTGSSSGSAGYTQLLSHIGLMSGEDIYVSPVHFTVTYQSATELTLSGSFPTITDITQFQAVWKVNTSGAVVVYFPQNNVFAWTGGTSRLTVTGASFGATDVFAVVVRGADRATSLVEDARNVLVQNHYPLQSDDVGVQLISSAQNITTSWVDLGPEVSMYGYNTLKLYLDVDYNSAADVRFRVLDKHESAGAKEYIPQIETFGTSNILVEPAYWQLVGDTDKQLTLVYETDNATPYVQVQVTAVTAGTGQILTAHYVRGWK